VRTGAATDGSQPPRFLADEDFNGNVVAGLRRAEPAIDILTAAEAGILQMKDPDVLAWARAHDRIVLSHDTRTMPDHFYSFLVQLAPGEHSPGIMLMSQELAIGPSIDAVSVIWACSSHEEW
jgi:hypothetical protein